ncbi:MAG: hypothetical protein LBE56_13020 [Tannerella sp.]|nr:hypothetical protein [Tannerella sp.]
MLYHQARLKIFENELNSLLHHSYAYANGVQYIDMNHPYTYDLDVFGDNSLFQLLNRCFTLSGLNYFAEQLQNPLKDADSIYRRQEAVKELQNNESDFIFHLLSVLSMNTTRQSSSTTNLIQEWLRLPNRIHLSGMMLWMLRIIPFVNLLLIVATVLFPPLFTVLLLFITTQVLMFYRFNKSVHIIKHNLNVIITDVQNFDIYSSIIKSKRFQSLKLQQLQSLIGSHQQSTRQLLQMLNVFDMGDSFLGAISNLLFFSHIRTAMKLERWKSIHRENFPENIHAIAEFETIISLAIFSINHPLFVFPSISEDNTEMLLFAKDLGHPLIDSEKRVNNNIAISNHQCFIITGANMAGKSTFLRTVGINTLLAQMGAPVCAAQFHFRPFSLFTSMRTIDNLDTGTSYFFAEALRIRNMLDFIKSGKNTLLIVDELFKGTNSEDRLKSSMSFIIKLLRYHNISSLIATHDLGITKLEKDYPDNITNYCFECFTETDSLIFDYKLKQGVNQSYNAYQLLKKLEILD